MHKCGAYIVAVVAGTAVGYAGAAPEPVKSTQNSHLKKSRGGSGGGIEAFPFSDNFDSYPDGVFPCATPACPGPNGWSVWYTPGSVPGTIASGNGHSGTKALRLGPFADVVQTGLVQSGQWVITTHVWYPQGVSDGYFIVMHSYNGVPAPTDMWAIQIHFNSATGMVYNDYTPGMQLPITFNQWIELRTEINLDTNTQESFYGGVLLSSGNYSVGGTPAIACIDLYSDGIDGMMYDTISMAPGGGPTCYANCDGSTTNPFLNVADFSCFLGKFAAADPYANCDGSTIQPVLNVQDFSCFLGKFAAGCSAP